MVDSRISLGIIARKKLQAVPFADNDPKPVEQRHRPECMADVTG